VKHVRALDAEPPLLLNYRTLHPAEQTRPASESAETWNAFKTDMVAYEELLLHISAVQQGLCIYCEQRLVDAHGKLIPLDYQVEHVLPKSGAIGRVLDWTNLVLCCFGGTFQYHQDASRQYTSAANTSCGQNKGNAALACDPRNLPLLTPCVETGIDGRLVVNADNCLVAGISPSDVTDAIALLSLDCERLRKARQDHRDNINAWFVPLLAELLSSAHLNPVQRMQMLGLFIAGRLQPDNTGHLRAWWSTERNALGPEAENWISVNQRLFAR
jgi:uncharacterized protein (TIGR02646 family)